MVVLLRKINKQHFSLVIEFIHYQNSVHHNRKYGDNPSVDSLELASPEHVRQGGLTCQCGCGPYITLQTDRKTLSKVST